MIASVSGILMVKVVPRPSWRVDVDDAADQLDIGLHHIHADAAAGHRGDRLRRREAGMEDELRHLGVGHLVDLGLARDVALHGLAADGGEIEALAVIGDLDRDRATFVIGGEADRAAGRLAGRLPVGGGFDAVVGRIAHHVGERVLDDLEDLTVQLGLGAAHDELDLLAEFRRQVANHARQLLPGIADRLHARLHDAFLQLGRHMAEALQGNLVGGIVVATGDLEELVGGSAPARTPSS